MGPNYISVTFQAALHILLLFIHMQCVCVLYVCPCFCVCVQQEEDQMHVTEDSASNVANGTSNKTDQYNNKRL